jgi:hypothetical protein
MCCQEKNDFVEEIMNAAPAKDSGGLAESKMAIQRWLPRVPSVTTSSPKSRD